jgi:hypothetical protein
MARLTGSAGRGAPERDDDDEGSDSERHVSSVMPSAIAKTPASMVPSSEGPEIHVGVLSMPHLRSERPASEQGAPAPTVINMNAPKSAAPTPVPLTAESLQSEPARADELSGVRHVLIANAPGLLREVCSPVVLNRCS